MAKQNHLAKRNFLPLAKLAKEILGPELAWTVST